LFQGISLLQHVELKKFPLLIQIGIDKLVYRL